jgi:hypothetical protein
MGKELTNVKEFKTGSTYTYLHYSDREAGNDPSEHKVKIKAVTKTTVGYDITVDIAGSERTLRSVAGKDGKFGDDCEFIKESNFENILNILKEEKLSKVEL